GVTALTTPTAFVEFSRQRGLAPDGRCKSFAAAADGTGFSEGIGLVVLELLADARRNGHRVLAVFRGSAVNSDGASNGLTAPNDAAQERVIRQALGNARLAADQVDVVEAHGTGTTLGDPIEAQALLATYGTDRTADRPLWLGSIKSNIGHAQAAAGVAGVIKMILAMRHGVLPASLHIDRPTPHVDWDAGTVRLLTEPVPWPSLDRPRRAAVSSFGISGTNAHVILEQPPEPVEPDGPPDGPAPAPGGVVPWVLSARSGEALRGQAAALAGQLAAGSPAQIVDIGWSLATTRSVFEHRAVVLGEDATQLQSGLRALAAGAAHPAVVTGVADADTSGPVLVFSGQGAQWAGMGAGLLESSPAFAARVAECEQALAPFVDWSLADVLRGVGDAAGLDRVDVVQPALWAVMVALAAVWAEHGVTPAAVVGHSQGEIAAACVAGALSLADGAKVVALRSQALRRLAGAGAMASLGVDEDTALRLLRQHGAGVVGVAAVNGPSSTVVSGPPDQVAAVVAAAGAEGLRARLVEVDYASHGPQIDQVTGELMEALTGIAPAGSPVAFYSGVTGARVATTSLDTGYWVANLRQPVRFADAVRALLDDGHRILIEASTHPVLALGMQETFEHAGVDAVTVATLRRDQGDRTQLGYALAHAFTAGCGVDWAGWFPADRTPRTVDLPTYSFQRQRYWLADQAPVAAGAGAGEEEEAGFWAAVEREDLAALSYTLRLPGGNGHRASLGAVLPALSSWRRARRDRSTMDSWRYRVEWDRVAVPTGGARTGPWLVVRPASVAGGWLDACTAALSAGGAQVHQLDAGDDADRQRLAGLLRARCDGGAAPAGVLSLLALAEGASAGSVGVAPGLTGTLALVQAMVDTGIEAPLWCATRGAVSVGGSDPVQAPVQAQLWGLGRVAALEHPALWGGLVDLPASPDAMDPAQLQAVLTAVPGEDQVALRPGGVFGRRLVPAPLGDRAPRREWKPQGTVLVTGGAGGLAAQFARWLVTGGAERVVLLDPDSDGPDSDSDGDGSGAERLASELAGLGAEVMTAGWRAGDQPPAADLAERLAEAGAQVTTIIHTPASGALTPLVELTAEQLAGAVLADPFRAGQPHLDELCDLGPDGTVVFCTSVAAVWGSRDHAAYAAAGAYLDALAQHRRAGGPYTVSVAWGLWDLPGGAGGGDAFVGRQAEQARRQGLPPLDPRLALGALRQVLDHGEPQVTIADVAWERFAPLFTLARPSRLLDAVPAARRAVEAAREPAGDEAAAPSELARELAASAEDERVGRLTELVRAHVAAVLRHETAAAVDPGRPFKELGFDSIAAVELRNRLRTLTGLRLPATLVFDHPTPALLARHLLAQVLPAGDGAPDPALGHLDELEAALAGLPADDPRRTGLVRRLQALVWRYAPAAQAVGAAAGDEDLTSATAEDVFALIDRELGV
ncbi:MAG TPA: acyltransferase domain-containing protein, partial [Micromonosporaceae bacterium]|nr:acyltransferase domain-containing protein [Micromonosporaceae bacterium]